MIYRVTYPLITCDKTRDFETRAEADEFARSRRDIVSPYMTMQSWQLVRVTEVQTEPTISTIERRLAGRPQNKVQP